jgi:carbon monoxide dehydrogenase subunit G
MNTSLRHTLAHLIAPALLCLSLLPQAAQAARVTGSGTSATETRSVGDFQAVRLSGSMDLQVRQGNTASVQVTADDNLLALLETVVETTANGPTLDVRWKKGTSLYTKSKVLVSVVTPRLTALTAAGAGDMQVEAFNTPALKLSISGSGDARLNSLSTEDLGISIAGSGDVIGTGSATRTTVSIAGSGDVRLSGMKSEEVSVTIAGSGDAAVNANKSLEVRIAGSGDVSYTGNATVKSKIAGSGSVNRR